MSKILPILIVIGILILEPLLLLWIINTLFLTGILINLKTWTAILLLQVFVFFTFIISGLAFGAKIKGVE